MSWDTDSEMMTMGFGTVIENKVRIWDRAAGHDIVRDWLFKPNAPTRVVTVTGAAGMGKTRFLHSFLQEAQTFGVEILSVDGMLEGQTPDDFLKPMEQVGWIQRSSLRPAEFRVSVSSGKRVLCIDHLDEQVTVQYWLQTVLLNRLPADDFLLLLAYRGTRRVIGSWSTSATELEDIHLTTLRRKEALDHLASLRWSVDNVQKEWLIRASHGHPLLLTRLAGRVVEQDIPVEQIRAELSDTAISLLSEVNVPAVLSGVEALSLLREANQDEISAVFDGPFSTDAYLSLSSLSFIHRGLRGLSIEEGVSTILRHDFYDRSPKRFTAWYQRAVHVLFEQMGGRTWLQRASLLSYILGLHMEYFECIDRRSTVSGLGSITTGMMRLRVDIATSADEPLLHDLLQYYAALPGQPPFFLSLAEQHELLKLVLRDIPENVPVIRDEQGVPKAMALILPMDPKMFTGLSVDVGKRLREHCQPWWGPNPKASDGVHTVVVPLMIADANPGADCQAEVWVTLISSVMSILSESLRGLLLFNHAGMPASVKQFLKTFPALNGQGSESGQIADFGVCVDFRGTGLQDWLNDLVPLTPSNAPLRPKVKRLSEEDLRDSLRHFYHAQYLTEFANERQLNVTGEALKDLILGFLITDQAPPPLTKEYQRILRVTYIDRPGNAEAIANRLAIGRTTYYRQLAEAHRHFAEAFTL